MSVLRQQIGYFWKIMIVLGISLNINDCFYILPILIFQQGLVRLIGSIANPKILRQKLCCCYCCSIRLIGKSYK